MKKSKPPVEHKAAVLIMTNVWIITFFIEVVQSILAFIAAICLISGFGFGLFMWTVFNIMWALAFAAFCCMIMGSYFNYGHAAGTHEQAAQA